MVHSPPLVAVAPRCCAECVELAILVDLRGRPQRYGTCDSNGLLAPHDARNKCGTRKSEGLQQTRGRQGTRDSYGCQRSCNCKGSRQTLGNAEHAWESWNLRFLWMPEAARGRYQTRAAHGRPHFALSNRLAPDRESILA